MNTNRHVNIVPSDGCEPDLQSVNYLDELYDGASAGYLSVWNKSTKRTEWFDITDREAARAHMLAASLSADEYFGWCPHVAPQAGRGSVDSACILPGLMIDVDLLSNEPGVHARQDLPSSWEEPLACLEEFGVPKPTAVRHSGNGAYFDWLFDRPWDLLPVGEREAAISLSGDFQKGLIGAFRTKGWHLDNVGDLARITRLPGTLNHKTVPAKPVSLLAYNPSARFTVKQMQEVTTALKAKYVVGAAPVRSRVSAVGAKASPLTRVGSPAKLANENSSIKPNFASVQAACAWAGGLAECPSIPEPDWHAGAGIVGRCEDGSAIFHRISALDPRYDAEETQAKIDRALAEAGPRTCEAIHTQLGFAGCASCVFYGNDAVHTPLNLGRVAPAIAALLAENVYDIGTTRFVDMTTMQSLDEKQFSAKYRHLTGQTTPTAVLLSNSYLKRVDRTDYLPGDENRFVTEGRVTAFNTWEPSGVKPEKGDCSILMDHIAHIIPDEPEREYFLDALASIVQRPMEKIRHVLLISGKPGTGKSFLGMMVKVMLGSKNVNFVESSHLTLDWTAHLVNRQALIIEEIDVFERMEVYNKLKRLIADDKTVANEKHARLYEARTPKAIFGFSNHETPILIDDHDRRFWFYLSPAEKLDEGYYTDLFTEGLKQVPAFVAELMERDISGFNPSGTPPMTVAKKGLLKSSAPVLVQELGSMMEEGEDPFSWDLFTLEYLLPIVQRRIGGRPLASRTLSAALRKLGAVPLEQVRLNGLQRQRYWAWQNVDTWQSASGAEIRDAIQKRNTDLAAEYLKKPRSA